MEILNNMHGTYEYTTCKCPYTIGSQSANLWFKHQYDEGKWELVCPVNNEIWGGNSGNDNLYIFRRWVEYTTPAQTIL